MMLGQILRRLAEISDEDIVAALAHDIGLLGRLRAGAGAHGQSLAGYIHSAACRFLERGSEEEWTTAIGRMQSDPSPGDRLVEFAIEQQLRRDGV